MYGSEPNDEQMAVRSLMHQKGELEAREHLHLQNIRELENEVAQLKGEIKRLTSKLADIDEDLRQRIPRSMRSEFY